MRTRSDLDEGEYQKLEEFRYQIRKFLAFSESAARNEGLEPQQHQALLVLRSVRGNTVPSIAYVAERLLLKHHSAVGLIDRLEALGLVSREQSPADGRQVLVRVTKRGAALLLRLSIAHREELEQSGPALTNALRVITRRKVQAAAAK